MRKGPCSLTLYPPHRCSTHIQPYITITRLLILFHIFPSFTPKVHILPAIFFLSAQLLLAIESGCVLPYLTFKTGKKKINYPSRNAVATAPGRRWSCWCFSASVAGYRTRLAQPLGHSSALWQFLWSPGPSAARSSRSRSWELRSPAAWNWCVACASWTVRRPQTPSGSVGLSGSSARPRPATSPAPASASEHSLGWCPAFQTYEQMLIWTIIHNSYNLHSCLLVITQPKQQQRFWM